MVSAIGSPTASNASSNSAEIAALQIQLANDQKQLQQDETPGAGAPNAATVQLAAAQIALVTAEIAQLSSASASSTVSSVSSVSKSSTLGNTINVTA
jgi:hypothetical protein